MTRSRPKWKRWALFETFVVGKENPAGPMLKRLRIIQTPWFGIYLHFIFREDLDRHLHDHPWNFLSVILKGGYTDEFLEGHGPWSDLTTQRWWPKGAIHKFKVTDWHRITKVLPGTTTLVFVGEPKQKWGFRVPEGAIHGSGEIVWTKMDWDEYMGLKGEATA